MMLIICDKNSYKAAKYLIEHINKSFVLKSLLELGQLICSAEISKVYKKIYQGQKLQEWIKNHPKWILRYFCSLLNWNILNIKLKKNTKDKIFKIMNDLGDYVENNCSILELNDIKYIPTEKPKTAIFRYIKEYAEFTEYESNSELPIDIATEEYKQYLNYKEEQFNKKKLIKKKGIRNDTKRN